MLTQRTTRVGRGTRPRATNGSHDAGELANPWIGLDPRGEQRALVRASGRARKAIEPVPIDGFVVRRSHIANDAQPDAHPTEPNALAGTTRRDVVANPARPSFFSDR